MSLVWSTNLIFNFGSNKACDAVVDQYVNNVNPENFRQVEGTYKKCCTKYFGNAQSCNLLKEDLKPFDNYYTPIVGVSNEENDYNYKDDITL